MNDVFSFKIKQSLINVVYQRVKIRFKILVVNMDFWLFFNELFKLATGAKLSDDVTVIVSNENVITPEDVGMFERFKNLYFGREQGIKFFLYNMFHFHDFYCDNFV
jgi:hypothetical protein